MALALAEGGQPEEARWIRFMSKWAELRSPATDVGRKLFLATTLVTVGFGYYVWLSGIWLTLLTIIGVVVAGSSPFGRELTMLERVMFSIDVTLPIVQLKSAKSDRLFEVLEPPHLTWFHIQTILSAVLFIYFAAGLSGVVR
jgi:hypothetical protein